VLGTVYAVVNKIFDIAPEILIGIAVDVVVKRDESFLSKLGVASLEAQVVLLGIATVLIWSGESLFQYLYGIEWRNLAQSLQHKARTDVYDCIQNLRMSELERRRQGELQTILTEDVNPLGKSGELKDVANGYARNYLIPHNLAVPAAGGTYRAWQHDIASREEQRKKERAEAEIERLAYYDPLTGLPNRRLFMDRLSHRVAVARRSDSFAALFFIDLDFFKHLNDALCHAVRALLLCLCGEVTERHLFFVCEAAPRMPGGVAK